MKKHFIVVFWVVFFLTLGFMGLRHSMATQETVSTTADTAPYVANEVLVKFRTATPDTSIIDGIDTVQGYIITQHKKAVTSGMWIADKEQNRSFHGDANLFRIHVPPLLGSEKAIEQLKTNPNVEYAEKNYLIQIQTDYYPYQWALNNTGSQGGTSDADIDAPEAWNIFTGSSDITIAIIDTGITLNHPDLQDNIWNNAGEMGNGKQTDGTDNDENGYIDDWHGWDFCNNDNDPTDDNSYDSVYHGTHVAGIAGADGSDNDGMKGVAWYSKLMALKAFDSYGNATTSDTIEAIDYARLNGAQVINASWGSTGYSYALYQAIERAMASGVLFVCAAGNYTQNMGV